MPALKFSKLHIVAPGGAPIVHRKKHIVHHKPVVKGTGVRRRGGFLPLAPLIPLMLGLAGAAGAPLARDAGNWIAKRVFKSHHVGSGVIRTGATRAKGGRRLMVRRPRVLFARAPGSGVRRAGGRKHVVHKKKSFIIRI